MKYLWQWLVISMIAAGCSQTSTDTFTVTGKVENFDKLIAQYPQLVENGHVTLMLFEVPLQRNGQPVQLDSVSVSAGNNTFTLQGRTTSTGMYNIVIGNTNRPLMVPLINDEDEISVNLDFSDPDKLFSVKGSAASTELQEFILTYSDKSVLLNKALNRLDSLKLFGAADDAVLQATNEKNAAIDEVNKYLKSFLASVKNPIVAAFALGQSAYTMENEFEAELTKLTQRFPQDLHLNALKTEYEVLKAGKAQQRPGANIWVGKEAPELTLPDVNGKNISLSDFRGKYVLVDFWASWCKPCMMENPNIVQAYNQFKDKNFTVLGVSLDRKKDDWLQAIREGNLTWTHISDLAFWNSKAVQIYQFNSIPFNILVDPQGIVVAENLRGEMLSEKLAEILQ